MEFEDFSDESRDSSPERDWDWGSFWQEDDRETLKRCTHSLGLDRNYVKNWESKDAFREFYQNWMDGMISSNDLTTREIQITTTDSIKEWVAIARQFDSDKILGFIRFLKKKGSVELTNFKAQLTRKSLSLGVSSKRRDDNQAGAHGEGFKVASLVMVRKNYQVRYETSNFYWTFKFGRSNRDQLCCRLSPMKDTELTKRQAKFRQTAGSSRKLTGNIWEDVTVKIGRVTGSEGKQINFDIFKEWIKVAFALVGPETFIRTLPGDLVLDQQFSGKLYLKGLFLSNSSGTLKFGYNFATGQVNRDRQQLGSTEEEAKILGNIWAEAIQNNEPGALPEYVKMLRENDDKNWDDVHLAEKNIILETASKIWCYLKEENPNAQLFYYGKNNEEDAQTIRRHLKMIPVPLPSCMWNPLRRFQLIRTPEEYRYHKLHKSEISTFPTTIYSEALRRTLKAALALDERVPELKLVFKSDSGAGLDLLLNGNELLVNEKWLDFHRSHEYAPCWISRMDIIGDIPCEHTITHLYELVLHELAKEKMINLDESKESTSSLQLRVAENIRQMPQMIYSSQSKQACEIIIHWEVSEGEMILKKRYDIQLTYEITLHQESTCAERRYDTLLKKTGMNEDNPPSNNSLTSISQNSKCQCPSFVRPHQKSGICFSGLRSDEKYFPMIARDFDQAFFGIPPPALQPRPEQNLGGQESHFEDEESRPEDEDSIFDTEMPRLESEELDLDDEGPRLDNGDLMDFDMVESTRGTPATAIEIEDTTAIASTSKTREVRPQAIHLDKSPISSLQAKAHELALVKGQIRAKDNELHRIGLKLQITEENLNSTLDALEAAKIELNRKTMDFEHDKSALSSRVEDLEAELQQLQEDYALGCENENMLGDEVERLEDEIQNHSCFAARESLITNHEMREQDASCQIDDLRRKIQELQTANNQLNNDLKEAEDAYDRQVELANSTALRRRAQHGVKREQGIEGGARLQESPDRRNKRQRTDRLVITVKQEGGTIDLTADDDLYDA